MAMQTKTHSIIEAVTNVTVGYIFAVGSQLLIFPFWGIDISFGDNLIIGLWFMAISIFRSYALRRFFTRRTEKLGDIIWSAPDYPKYPTQSRVITEYKKGSITIKAEED